MRKLSCILVFAVSLGAAAQTPAPPNKDTPSKPSTTSTDDLYEMGKQLFDQLAPPEVKEQYEFPSKERWDEFATRLQHALESDSLEDMAVYAPEGRAALPALRLIPGCEDYAEWLEQRLDEIEGAQQALAPRTAPLSNPKAIPGKSAAIPYYDVWTARVRGRPVPERAAELMPRLRAAFQAEKVPPELAWLAEAESSLNPSARSPAGARGLFQFMPDTARSLGLGTSLPDDRTDPEKSAHAAARHLRSLQAKFGSWPLTLAAYNAGEGRVSRALAARGAKDFAGVASALPAETRMYVPKVCALVALRTGVVPDQLEVPH